jgi:Lar family restriction alleviation protein
MSREEKSFTEGNEGNKGLADCPFCGQQPAGVVCDRDGGVMWRVACICGACGPLADTQAAALDQWNGRPAPAAVPGPIATPQQFLRALYAVGEAARHIQLGRLPESVDGMNAAAMADALHMTIVAGQMEPAHAPDALEQENEYGEPQRRGC